MNRIAIFGGTFNPIHNGHLHIAQQFQKQLRAQRVLFIPTFVPPHKRARTWRPRKTGWKCAVWRAKEPHLR